MAETPKNPEQNNRSAKRVAWEKESKLQNLQSIINVQNQVNGKLDDAIKSLKQAMALSIILDRELSSGWYREINAKSRLRTRVSTQTIHAALGQLLKVIKLSKVIIPVFEKDTRAEIESPSVFE